MNLQREIESILGWKKKAEWWADGMGGSPESKHMVWHQHGVRKDKGPPNYVGNLNAMHKVIMDQTPAFRKAMRFWLFELTDQMSWAFADAETMAKAFVNTWRDLNP